MSSTFTSPVKHSTTPTPTPTTFTRASSLELINSPLILLPDGSPQRPFTKSRPESISDMRIAVTDSRRRECYIDNLPNEILFMVFSYLGVTGICRSGQVCHRWREVSQDEVLWKKRYERLWILSDFESVRSKYRYRLTTAEYNSNTWFQRYGVLFKSTFIWKASARIIIEDNHDEGLNHVIRHRNLQQHIQSLHQQQPQNHNNNHNHNQPQRQQIILNQIQNQIQDAQEIDETDTPQNTGAASQDVVALNLQPQSNPNSNSNSNSNSVEISQSHEHTFSSPPPHPSSSSSSSSGLQLNISSTLRSPRNRSVDVRFEAQRIDNSKHERIVEELEMEVINEADF